MKYNATGRNCNNIFSFATVGASLMTDFMVVIIDHPHCPYANFSCVAVPEKTGNVLCGLLYGNIAVLILVVKHSESDLIPVQL
jgi:hypothetical protein